MLSSSVSNLVRIDWLVLEKLEFLQKELRSQLSFQWDLLCSRARDDANMKFYCSAGSGAGWTSFMDGWRVRVIGRHDFNLRLDAEEDRQRGLSRMVHSGGATVADATTIWRRYIYRERMQTSRWICYYDHHHHQRERSRCIWTHFIIKIDDFCSHCMCDEMTICDAITLFSCPVCIRYHAKTKWYMHLGRTNATGFTLPRFHMFGSTCCCCCCCTSRAMSFDERVWERQCIWQKSLFFSFIEWHQLADW